MKQWNRVAIVGVGLIGGSIGLALMRRGIAGHVVGIGQRAQSLAAAQRVGAVHSTSGNLAAAVAEADLVVICTPVATIVEQALAAARACKPGALLTDAGSTKAQIVAGVESQLYVNGGWQNDVRFVGSHPIAGDHRKGVDHARADLFERRVTVLTPTANTLPEDRESLVDFWSALGSRVVEMSPDEHDQSLAAISHLPHLVAAAVAATTPAELVSLAGGGWLDTTRVAAGDPALWQQILLTNQAHVLAALDRTGAVPGPAAAGDSGRRCRQLGEIIGRCETDPRCCGKLTSIRGRANPTARPKPSPPRRPTWASSASCAVAAARGYLVEGAIERADVERAAHDLLVDTVVERDVRCASVGGSNEVSGFCILHLGAHVGRLYISRGSACQERCIVRPGRLASGAPPCGGFRAGADLGRCRTDGSRGES